MNYFMIGIKGSGMASLAQILLDQGHTVSGSDIDDYIFTQDALIKRNVEISSFNKNNIKKGSVIIYGNSFDFNHVEMLVARTLNLEMYRYTEMLSKIIKDNYTICVAGTHGKTTTTGLVNTLFNGFAPTGYLIGDGHGHLESDMKYFIVESCEYQDNYLNYYPKVAIINNIELDHVDYFKTYEQYINSFANFTTHASDYVILNGNDENVLKINKRDNFYYFGTNNNCDFQATNIEFTSRGVTFNLCSNYNRINKVEVYKFDLHLFGHHMLLNCLASIATLVITQGIEDYPKIEKQLNGFTGVSRRFDIVEKGSNVFVDDYAHHPTAIKLMIDTVRQKYPEKKVIAFFKPDRYSRVDTFKLDIAHTLELADEVFLFDFPHTSVKEDGHDITIQNVLDLMNKGTIIDELVFDVSYFKNRENCVFLMMSSKNVYNFREKLISCV